MFTSQLWSGVPEHRILLLFIRTGLNVEGCLWAAGSGLGAAGSPVSAGHPL